MEVDINNIIFYCHEKNGDCFVNKGYVKKIMQHMPDLSFSYAHDHHISIVQDLDCRFVRTFQIPDEVKKTEKAVLHEDTGTMFINIWIGAWIGKYLVPGQHGNFPLFHRAWSEFLNMLEIPVEGDYDYYLPETNWNSFDLSAANLYLHKIFGKPLIIFCNGIQQSGQSAMGPMTNTIHKLATKYPTHEFLVTYKLDFNLPNITYTDDLFGSKEGNLNQIGYISRAAKLIVGKNSGPFTFCHTKENLNDPNKNFLSFNFRPTDYLLGEGEYHANSFFNATTNEDIAKEIVEFVLNKTDNKPGKKPLITIG